MAAERSIVRLLCAVVCFLCLVGSSEQACQVGDLTLQQVLSRQKDLSVFTSMVNTAGLIPTLSEDVAITIFAPLDFAFGNLLEPGQSFFGLVGDPDIAEALVNYHTTSPPHPKRLFEDGGSVDTALESGGKRMNLTLNEDDLSFPVGWTIDGEFSSANITQADVFACNSVIHKIDNVLLPSKKLIPSKKNSLAAAIKVADEFDTLLTAGDKDDAGEGDDVELDDAEDTVTVGDTDAAADVDDADADDAADEEDADDADDLADDLADEDEDEDEDAAGEDEDEEDEDEAPKTDAGRKLI